MLALAIVVIVGSFSASALAGVDPTDGSMSTADPASSDTTGAPSDGPSSASELISSSSSSTPEYLVKFARGVSADDQLAALLSEHAHAAEPGRVDGRAERGCAEPQHAGLGKERAPVQCAREQ